MSGFYFCLVGFERVKWRQPGNHVDLELRSRNQAWRYILGNIKHKNAN